MQSYFNAIGIIEYQIVILTRRAEFTRTLDPKISIIDRSGYLLLRQLEKNGPQGVKALADEFMLDISTVSRQTAALEAKGFIQRCSDPNDGRVSLIEITPSGQSQLEQVRKERLSKYSRMLDDWPKEDCEKLAELMERLNQTFIEYQNQNK